MSFRNNLTHLDIIAVKYITYVDFGEMIKYYSISIVVYLSFCLSVVKVR